MLIFQGVLTKIWWSIFCTFFLEMSANISKQRVIMLSWQNFHWLHCYTLFFKSTNLNKASNKKLQENSPQASKNNKDPNFFCLKQIFPGRSIRSSLRWVLRRHRRRPCLRCRRQRCRPRLPVSEWHRRRRRRPSPLTNGSISCSRRCWADLEMKRKTSVCFFFGGSIFVKKLFESHPEFTRIFRIFGPLPITIFSVNFG